MLIDQKKLDLYVEKKFNVLFEGERGVGKTSVIMSTFNKVGLRVKYFSAPTMDPWTDLVGVPTTVTRDDKKEVLRLIPPEDFVDDKYDVIFIDELNRAPPKVMNALMELIQFKSINGRPYNIQMIWAAINPPTDEYHVETLDKAVEDRFHIKVKFPYKVDEAFFTKTYGVIGKTFCEWWNNQPADIQKEVSPRRLFDSVDFYNSGGDIADMITVGNTDKLKQDLKEVSQVVILEADFNKKEVTRSKPILNRNYSVSVEGFLKQSSEIFNFYFPHMRQEWLSKEFLKEGFVYEQVFAIAQGSEQGIEGEMSAKAEEIIQEIANLNPHSSIVRNNMSFFEKYLSEEQKVIQSSYKDKYGNEYGRGSRFYQDQDEEDYYHNNSHSHLWDERELDNIDEDFETPPDTDARLKRLIGHIRKDSDISHPINNNTGGRILDGNTPINSSHSISTAQKISDLLRLEFTCLDKMSKIFKASDFLADTSHKKVAGVWQKLEKLISEPTNPSRTQLIEAKNQLAFVMACQLSFCQLTNKSSVSLSQIEKRLLNEDSNHYIWKKIGCLGDIGEMIKSHMEHLKGKTSGEIYELYKHSWANDMAEPGLSSGNSHVVAQKPKKFLTKELYNTYGNRRPKDFDL